MKTLNKIWGIGLVLMAMMLMAPKSSKAQDGEYVTDQQFYDELGPYGTWVSDPEYGNVWIPDADEDFRPYATNGHWVVTEYGNTWVSDYSWGWAPFHYGRWRYDDYYGWEWVPGHTWAPAWVSWRHGGGYYGWAPLTPGVSVSISIGSGYRVPDNYWVCAPEAYITSPRIYSYYAPRTRVVNIIHNTTVINNTYVRNSVTYVSGPRVADIRRVTRNNNVRVYNISNSNRPGAVNVTNNTVNIYRPAIKKARDARPARVVDAKAYRDQHPNDRIAAQNQAAINRANAARLAAAARSEKPDNKFVRVNAPANHPVARQGQPNNPQQQQRAAQSAQKNAQHKQDGQEQRAQQAAQQQQQRVRDNAQRQQQTAQQAQQHQRDNAQKQQQSAEQRAQQAVQQQQHRAQGNGQAQQQKAQQAAQQQQQRAQENAQRQQQAQQQRAQQAAQEKQQRAQENVQRQQQAQQQRAQQAAQQKQQRAQENAQRQQQVQQQRAQQAAQQKQQRAQENAQRQQQAQQQRAQQKQQRAQENAQRQQQAQQQHAQQQQQRAQRQQPPQHRGHGDER